MRRSLARREIDLTSASVGFRSVSRSVSRMQGLASCKVGVGISCSMSGSFNRSLMVARILVAKPASAFAQPAQQKREAGFPPPLWSLFELHRFNRTRRTQLVHRLLGRSFRHRNHRHEGAATRFRTKLDMTLDLGEQSMVSAHADIKAGVPRGAALTRDDVAGSHMLAAIGLDAKAFARRITAVTR